MKVSICVDKLTAQALNLGKDTLQDMIILRIENSNDYFVDIKAEYERSCYGMALEELVMTLQPVSTVPLPSSNFEEYIERQREMLLNATMNDPNSRLSIPKELWRLVDALWSGNALKEKDLFSMPGDSTEIRSIRYAIDHGSDFPVCSPHSLVESVTTFLAALPKPLIPVELYPLVKFSLSSFFLLVLCDVVFILFLCWDRVIWRMRIFVSYPGNS